MSIQVLDNSISLYSQELIEKIVTHQDFPWYYNPSTLNDGKRTSAIDKFQLAHLLVVNGEVNSEYAEDILGCFVKMPAFATHRVWKAKLNLNFPYKKRNLKMLHHDTVDDRDVTYLYYCIDSDGPTRFFPNWWRTKKVHPKRGRIVRFPSYTKHSATLPYKYDNRIVLNIVFKL